MSALVQIQWVTFITPERCRASSATGTDEDMTRADRGGGATTDGAAKREIRPPSGVRC